MGKLRNLSFGPYHIPFNLKMPLNERCKGYCALISGCTIELVVGSIFTWGSIAPYITSYYRLHDESVTMDSTFLVLPFQMLLACIVMYFGGYLNTFLHPRWMHLIATICASGGLFGASMTKSYTMFLVYYGIGLSVALGIAFTTPIIVSWSYFPTQHGRVSGILTSTFGLSTTFVILISSRMINPDNVWPDIRV